MQNASAPPDTNNVIIEEVPPGQSQDTENNDEVPPSENNDEVPRENETPRTEEIFSSYEDQGRIPPPFDNHNLEDVGTE